MSKIFPTTSGSGSDSAARRLQLRLQLLSGALIGAGGLAGYFGLSLPISICLLLAGLALLLLTPRK